MDDTDKLQKILLGHQYPIINMIAFGKLSADDASKEFVDYVYDNIDLKDIFISETRHSEFLSEIALDESEEDLIKKTALQNITDKKQLQIFRLMAPPKYQTIVDNRLRTVMDREAE